MSTQSLSTTLLEDQELEARAKAAFLGFAKMRIDIHDGKTMIYNVYNNRPLVSSTVSHLKQSMVENGIRWWDEPIPVLVRHNWINVGQLKADRRLREALPLLEWAPGAEAVDEVHILCGQHRLAALQDYRADLQDKREKIRERLRGGVSEFDAHALRQKSDVVESKMEDILCWGVALYDLGMVSGFSVVRFLTSRAICRLSGIGRRPFRCTVPFKELTLLQLCGDGGRASVVTYPSLPSREGLTREQLGVGDQPRPQLAPWQLAGEVSHSKLADYELLDGVLRSAVLQHVADVLRAMAHRPPLQHLWRGKCFHSFSF